MFLKRSTQLIWAVFFIASAGAPLSQSASFSFTGTFQQDATVRLFGFTLAAPGTATLETWSYGGGKDAAGATIPAGGFSTVLSVFTSSGSLINYQVNGGCPPQNIDSSTGLCGDTVLTEPGLAAGSYIVAVTEDFNIPNGITLSAGFFEDGQGNFSGPAFCGSPGSFKDFNCNQRTANFELDILGVTAAAPLPEPASVMLFGAGTLALATYLRRKRKTSNAPN